MPRATLFGEWLAFFRLFAFSAIDFKTQQPQCKAAYSITERFVRASDLKDPGPLRLQAPFRHLSFVLCPLRPIDSVPNQVYNTLR